MEDYKLDVVTGEGAYSTTITLPLPPFTCIGATTRTGLLTSPLLSRFGHIVRLDFYSDSELATIITRSAGILKVPIDDAGSHAIASRARGTPRIANRLLRNVRDFADVLGKGVIDAKIADTTCERLRIDALGLDDMDRRLLSTIIDVYDGGPVGVEALAASRRTERHTRRRLRAVLVATRAVGAHAARSHGHSPRVRASGAAGAGGAEDRLKNKSGDATRYASLDTSSESSPRLAACCAPPFSARRARLAAVAAARRRGHSPALRDPHAAKLPRAQ